MNKQTDNSANSLSSILIVDDTPQNIQVLGTILTNEDYNVEFATNGKQALKWINNKAFDLILLDVMMPEMSGFEVCEIIRQNEHLNDIPIIFLTARTDKESIIEGFDIGAQDYITKPFDSKELLARVKTHLDLKNSKEKLKSINLWLEEKVKERTQELQISNDLLEGANKELLDLDNQKAEFLNIISHEIRTPLNGIMGFWNILRAEVKNKDLNYYLDHMKSSVERLEKFSKTALLITELRTRTIALKCDNTNLSLLIQEVLNENNEIIANKKIQTKIDTTHDKLQISCDPYLIKKCIENVIENAIKYSPHEGCIHISSKSKDNYLNYIIKDEGPGLPKELIKNPFSLFAPDNHVDKNAGLGLALINLIMKAHKGSIKVSNDAESGALVELSFPK